MSEYENMQQPMKEKTNYIEAYVDPFELPMQPNAEMESVKGLAESFAKGQSCAKRIGLTLLRPST